MDAFRSFIARGNVFDLAVGIVIGAAFTSVVQSFVNDILMPPVGLLLGGVDFSELYMNLSDERYASLAEAREAGAATVNYGVFINQVISFLIVGLAVFMLVRGFMRLRARGETVPVAPTEKVCGFCRLAIPLEATRCAHCTSMLEIA
jgi:large conductance mechanosensitive channel